MTIVEKIDELIETDFGGSLEEFQKYVRKRAADPVFVPDSIVQIISQRFIDRAKIGWNKYGTNLDRKDLSTTEWVQHLQDELHDAYVYSEKLKQDEIKRNRLLDLSLMFIEIVTGNVVSKLDYNEFQELKLWYDEQKKEKTTNQVKPTPNQNY